MTSLNDNHMDKQDEIANQRLLKAAFERLADSPKEAHLLFMMAAVGGQDPEAYYFLGRQYFEGHGVDKNVAKGIEHITTSAEKGYTEASFFLACKYYWGKEVEPDYDKAYKYALAASEAGHIEACNLLADCYVHGHGVKQDSLEGVRWLHTYMERKRANDPEFAARMDDEMNEYAYLANDDFFDPEDEVEIFYHGSHVLFENFDLSHALEGDGKVKFGYGVYLTSNYASAAHYSGANPDATEHYVYTVMGVPKCEDNYIAFKQPVIPEIIARAEEQLGLCVSRGGMNVCGNVLVTAFNRNGNGCSVFVKCNKLKVVLDRLKLANSLKAGFKSYKCEVDVSCRITVLSVEYIKSQRAHVERVIIACLEVLQVVGGL